MPAAEDSGGCVAAQAASGAVAITDQTRTFRVEVTNVISSRGLLRAEFDEAEEAFRYARENRCYFNNTRITLWKIVGRVTRTEARYRSRSWTAPAQYVEVTRPLLAELDINDLTTLDDVANLGSSAVPAGESRRSREWYHSL